MFKFIYYGNDYFNVNFSKSFLKNKIIVTNFTKDNNALLLFL